MTKITTLKPPQDRADKLTIDVVVKFPSVLHRICKLIFGKNELYLILTTHKSGEAGIELHTSYHRSGKKHGKLTRGKLRQATFKFNGKQTKILGIETLGEAIPHAKDTEILLWKEQGAPLNSIKGVVQVNPTRQGVQGCTNISAVATGYPVIQKSDADYVFEIDAESTPWIDMAYFLVEPSNIKALEEQIEQIVGRWNTRKSKIASHLPELMAVEKAILFKNLSPWLAIVLFKFSENAEGSEYS